MVTLMMSGDKCRAKAREALDLAERAPSPQWQAEWATMARDWRRLGAMADDQDRMECDWLILH